jgi:uncharacterized membrane protein YphA (DoxX/SURF4 family)
MPELAVRANAANMVVSGSMLALGILPRFAAAMLIGSLIPTTVVGHQFWKAEGPQAGNQLTQFLKNLGLIGGLLAVVVGQRDS